MYDFRPATREDAAIITVQRHRIYLDMGFPDDDRLRQVLRAFHPWVRSALERGVYLGVLAAQVERVVAGAGLVLFDAPPSHGNPAGVQGYLDNVFTDPAHRRQGLARQLIGSLLEEARLRGIRLVSLHASSQARGLYERLGFQATADEMRWVDPED